MATLYETLADAQNGQVMAAVGREFGLSPEQTQSAVAALLPAISMGLKRATQTPMDLPGCSHLWASNKTFTTCIIIPTLPSHGKDARRAMKFYRQCSDRPRRAARSPIMRNSFPASPRPF